MTSRSAIAEATRSRTRSRTAVGPGWSTSTTCRRCHGVCGHAVLVRREGPHGGPVELPIRTNVDDWLRERPVDPPAVVRMLANPRVLGHVFNPLSLFYCHDADGPSLPMSSPRSATYGGRRCYLLEPADDGRATADKTFYVSPFHGVDGHYELSVPAPGDELAVTVTLRRTRQGAIRRDDARHSSRRRTRLSSALHKAVGDADRQPHDPCPRHPPVPQGPAAGAAPRPSARPTRHTEPSDDL